MESAVRNAACRFMRSNNSVGRSWDCGGEVFVLESRTEDSLFKGERVGVLLERKSRSKRLLAPLVGVLIEGGDCAFKIGFLGVCGTRCNSFERRCAKGLMSRFLTAAERKFEASSAALSSSLSSNLLFFSVVECLRIGIVTMVSI